MAMRFYRYGIKFGMLEVRENEIALRYFLLALRISAP